MTRATASTVLKRLPMFTPSSRVTKILWLAFQFAVVWNAAGQYPIRLGSAGQEYGKCAATDHEGNIIVGMLFQNTIDFDPGANAAVLGTPPGIDLALAKYTPAGQLVWARNISGTTGTSANTVCTPHGVAVDKANNIYCVGYFGLTTNTTRAVVDFDPGPGTLLLTNNGGWDPFIAKFDSSGNVLWARTLGSITNSPNEERAWDLAVDNAGNVYVTGFITGTYDLDAGPGSNLWTSAGEKDSFLVKYDRDGNHLWGFVLNDTGDAATSLKETSVALDDAGHVFLMGHFNGTLDADPGVGVSNLVSAGGSDMFIARYTTNGVFERAIRLGGTLNEVAPPGALRCDGAGNLYLAARFRGVLDLDPGPGLKTITNLTAADNIWIASYDNNLALRWGFQIVSDGSLDGGHRVAFDSQTNVFVTGWFGGTADFDGSTNTCTLTSRNNNGAADVFLAKYDRNGNFLWARGFGGATTNASEQSIAAGLTVDFAGNAYLTGQYYGTNVTFYPYNPPGTLPDSLGQNDGFIVKYTPAGQIAGHELSLAGIEPGPNAIRLRWDGAAGMSVQATTNLLQPAWQDLPGTAGNSTLDLPRTNSRAFFRLIQR